MMRAAKAAKDAGIDERKLFERSAIDGSYKYEKNDLQKNTEFYDGVKEKAEERLEEKK